MQDQLEITDTVPIPKDVNRGLRKYPFKDMAVGQSFFVIPAHGSNPENAAHQHGHRYGKKFCCRPEGDGIRIWRIA